MELKATTYGVKQIEGRSVTGIASVFGNVDTGFDRMWPGAFTKTISERRAKFRHLWNHDSFNPPIATIDDIKEIGRADLPDTVLAAAPDAVGGLQITRTYLDTPRGNEVLAGLKLGAINEMSFGYDAIPGKVQFTEEGNNTIRELYEVRLWDTSDVNWGMNEATVGVKGAVLTMPLEVLLKHIEAVMQHMKAGARHSANDTKLLNAIHKAAVSLGATNCKGSADEEDETEEDAGKSRAGTYSGPLTLHRLTQDLADLELAILTT